MNQNILQTESYNVFLPKEQKSSSYAFEMLHISKSFGHVKALNDVSIRVKHNSVYALVGENGAGKSTLMSVLFGLYKKNDGLIKVKDYNVEITDVNDANRLGIGMVQQHFQLVSNLSVWRNIALGRENHGIFINKKQILKKVKHLMEKYDLFVPILSKVKNITISMQQKTEILKILYRDCSLIIFDEPTSVLYSKEIDNFLNLIRRLKADGKTIIYIAHQLDHVFAVSDEIAVLNNGTLVYHNEIAYTNPQEISKKMFPTKQVSFTTPSDLPPVDVTKESWLEVSHVTLSQGLGKKILLNDISLKVRPGEIVGIAGINDNGQDELADVITGMQKLTNGHVLIRDKRIDHKSIYFRQIACGLSKIPGDRWKHALLKKSNVIDNFILPQFRKFPFSEHGVIRNFYNHNFTQKMLKKFNIIGAQNGFIQTSRLSGGNQQKIILARELTRDFKILLLVQPTRGLDIDATSFIYKKIFEAKKEEKAILLISYDLNEIMHLSDRILVMRQGTIINDFVKNNTSLDEVALSIVKNINHINQAESKSE